MSLPLLTFLGVRPTSEILKKGREQAAIKWGTLALALTVFDVLAFITSLVLGILGATQVVTLPAAACYALFGVSGGIGLLWIGVTAPLMRQKLLTSLSS